MPDHRELDPIVGEIASTASTTSASSASTRSSSGRQAHARQLLPRRGRRDRPWLFPQLVRITREWIDDCVVPARTTPSSRCCCCASTATPPPSASTAPSCPAPPARSAWCRSCGPTRPIGSTDGRLLRDDQALLRRRARATSTASSLDSGWEAKLGQVLDEMPEVVSFVKNQGLNFKIPYTLRGPRRPLRARLPHPPPRSADGRRPLLTLVLEVTGERKKEKQAKVADGARPLGPGRQQLGRPGPLGVPRGHRPVGCGEPHPVHVPATAGSVKSEASGGASGAYGIAEDHAGPLGPPRPRDPLEHPHRRAGVLRPPRREEADDRALPPRPDPRPAARLEGQGRAGRRPDLAGPGGARSTSRRPSTRWPSSRSCAPSRRAAARGPARPVRPASATSPSRSEVDFYRHAGSGPTG